jgi:hypothetical protein
MGLERNRMGYSILRLWRLFIRGPSMAWWARMGQDRCVYAGFAYLCIVVAFWRIAFCILVSCAKLQT